MKTIPVYFLLLTTIFISACSKSSDSPDQQTQIDVSQQWRFDAVGSLLIGPGDAQWQSTTFSTTELNLFSSMDTANLAGTTRPSAVLEPNGYNAIYPNPFILSASHAMRFSFPNGYGGQFVLKLVYVDSLMNPIFKKVIRLQSNVYPPPTTSGIDLLVIPNVPVGRHRLYYTFSAVNNPHFYKVWGNIQCVP